MTREVRRVPPGWEHPRKDGHLVPLDTGFAKKHAEWIRDRDLWAQGLYLDFHTNLPVKYEGEPMPFEEWATDEPKPGNFMPDFPEGTATHYQMYETCTEGTPISPVMESPEGLARWLVDNNANSFANETATYEEWLYTIQQGRKGFCKNWTQGPRHSSGERTTW